jgi:hypothetical protein
MNYWDGKEDLNPGGTALTTSGANTAKLDAGKRVSVSRIRFVTTTALTVSDTIVSIRKRKVDGTSSTTLGAVTLPFTGSALNDVQFVNFLKPSTTGAAGADSTTALPTTVFTTSGKGPVYLEADEEIAVVVTSTSTAGAVLVYFEGVNDGFNQANTVKVPVERTLV